MEVPNWLRAPPKETKLVKTSAIAKHVSREDMVRRARSTGHPNPEKMADTMLRARERATELRAARPRSMLITEVPKTAAVATTKPNNNNDKCKAKTLEGRQCGFRAVCNGFCKKHTVTTKI